MAASRNQAGGITKAGRPDDPSVKDADEVARALGADLDNGLSSQEVSRRLALKILSPDINPLLADHDGVIALDARLRVGREAGAGAAHFAITPYPAELAQSVDWQGEQIVVRPIRPEDEPQHRAFVERPEPQDLWLRFFSARRELPRSELARLTQIDYAREMAFIAVRVLPDSAAQTLGVVRAIIDPDNVDAEFAIIVRSDLKGRGLGHLLLSKMIEFRSGRSTHRMVGYVLGQNDAMRELACSHGFVVNAAASDVDALFVTLALSEKN